MTPSQVSRGGFILIAALWLLVSLGAIGLHAGLRMRTERLAAANVLDGHRAREAAFAGAEYARSRLTAAMFDRAEELRAEAASSRRRQDQNRLRSVSRLFGSSDPIDDPWRNPEELVVLDQAFGDARFSLRLRDTAAALNLNSATEEMLRAFFSVGLELDYALADRLTQAILDWRDPDDLPRIGGGEREEYLRAGALVLPLNRPFGSLDELRHVQGMTQAVYDAARPYLTLIGSGRINVNAAPVPVLLALPGMTPEAAQEIVALRESGALATSANQLERLLPGNYGEALDDAGRQFSQRVTFRTDEVEIISDGRVEGSPVEARLRLVVARSQEGAIVTERRFR